MEFKPLPSTAMVLPPFSSAPAWAALSIPSASPLVIVRPDSANPHANSRAILFPEGVGFLLPTIPICIDSRTALLPRTYNPTGGSGICFSKDGYSRLETGIKAFPGISSQRKSPSISRQSGCRKCLRHASVREKSDSAFLPASKIFRGVWKYSNNRKSLGVPMAGVRHKASQYFNDAELSCSSSMNMRLPSAWLTIQFKPPVVYRVNNTFSSEDRASLQ